MGASAEAVDVAVEGAGEFLSLFVGKSEVEEVMIARRLGAKGYLRHRSSL